MDSRGRLPGKRSNREAAGSNRLSTGPDRGAVVNWAPTTPLRRLVFWITQLLPWVLVVVGVVVFYWEFDVLSLEHLSEPLLVGFLVLSALPAVAIAGYVWYVDVSVRTSRVIPVAMILLGGVMASVAHVGIELVGGYYVDVWETSGFLDGSVPLAIVFAGLFLFVAAPIEESVKLLVVRLYAFSGPHFTNVISGALFGALAGLGFATVENAVVISEGLSADGRAGDGVGATATIRAIAGPGHVLYAAIAGYYLGLARFNPRYRIPLLVQGLAIAICLHAIYNIMVFDGTVDVSAHLAVLLGVSEMAALVSFAVFYHGLVLIVLIHKLSIYRNAHCQAMEPADGDVDLTEFDP